ncbi:hypothetical protein D1872_222660 [compost metagenome]
MIVLTAITIITTTKIIMRKVARMTIAMVIVTAKARVGLDFGFSASLLYCMPPLFWQAAQLQKAYLF